MCNALHKQSTHASLLSRNNVPTKVSHYAVLPVQADAGAQAVQIFDSWASNLAPQDYDIFAGPYINQIVDSVKQTHPDLPLILYISGSGGLLERMAKCNVEVISIDGSVDMKDAIRRIGPNFAVQVKPLIQLL